MLFQPSPLSPSFTHFLPCSGDSPNGITALKLNMSNWNWPVVEYLRSVGAPEK